MEILYTAWFWQPTLSTDDEDYEWPACFAIIDAPDVGSAKSWGDHLASRYEKSSGQVLLSSSAKVFGASTLPQKDDLPNVHYGHEATDDEIGW